MRAIGTLLLIIAMSFGRQMASQAAQQSPPVRQRWEELPLRHVPREPGMMITQMAIDPDGTLWVVSRDRLYYGDGKQFADTQEKLSPASNRAPQLYGGGDRPLFVTTTSAIPTRGALYALSAQAEFLSDFEIAADHPPQFHVGRNGQVFLWGSDFVADFDFQNRKWNRHVVETKLVKPLFLDFPTETYLFDSNRIVLLGAKLTSRPVVVVKPGQGTPEVRGSSWGDDRIILNCVPSNELFAYDLKSLAPLTFPGSNMLPLSGPVSQFIPRRDGSVWIVKLSYHNRTSFWRLAPDGTLREVAGLGAWDINLPYPHRLRNAVDADDGSLWLTRDRGGLLHWKDDKFTRYGWNEGVVGSFDSLVSDRKGNLFAATSNRVMAFREVKESVALPPRPAFPWSKYSVEQPPAVDERGNLWCFSQQYPDQVLKWDGDRWHMLDAGVDPELRMLITDDQEHALLTRGYITSPGWDIDENGVTAFKTTREMLVAAMDRGVQRFRCDSRLPGCVIHDNKIWYCSSSSSPIDYFDGNEWDTLKFPVSVYQDFRDNRVRDDLLDAYYSPSFGPLFARRSGAVFMYDRGQFVPVKASPDSRSGRFRRFLPGPHGDRMYDEKLLAQQTGNPTVIEQQHEIGGRRLSTAYHWTANSGAKPRFEPSFPAPFGRLDGWLPAPDGGWWGTTGNGPARIFGGKIRECDFQGTPIFTHAKHLVTACTDRRGNLWFFRQGTLYRWDASGFTVVADRVQQTNQPWLRLKVGVQSPFMPQNLQLFWRVSGGAWQFAPEADWINVQFDRGGVFNVEIVAMNQLGAVTPKPARVAVEVRLEFPDTTFRGDWPVEIDDLLWEVPVRVLPTKAEAKTRLLYRKGNSTWLPLLEEKYVPMAEMPEGAGSIEVVAEEDGRQDPTPLRIDFKYQPNFDLMISRRLDRIDEGGADEFQAVKKEFKLMGAPMAESLKGYSERMRGEGQRAMLLDRLSLELIDSEARKAEERKESPPKK